MAAGTFDTVLRGLLTGYKHPDAARNDLTNALLKYRDLKPQRKNFVFNDGSTKTLLCLDGTLPICYKGSTYNIPIIIWLLEGHPYDAPMVFVVPTNSMSIRAGHSVDTNGTVTLSYLTEWRSMLQTSSPSTMLGLLQDLAENFGESPPVFSKPPQRPQQPTAGPQLPYPSAAGVAQPAGLPYPASGGGSSALVSGPPAGQLPYPAYSGQQQQLPPGAGQLHPPGLPYPIAPTMPTPGMYQQQPPPQPHMPAGQGGGYGTATMPVYPLSHAAGAASLQQPPYQHVPNPYGATPAAAGLPYGSYPSAGLAYPSAAAPAGTAAPGYANNVAGGAAGQYLSDEHVKMSLLSAAEDKMRRKLRERYAQAGAEMEVLRKVQKELTNGEQQLTTMVQALAAEQKEVEKTKKYLQEKIDEMKVATAKLDSRDQMEPEDVVVPTAPLYKQLLTAFAEEEAIEDVVYCLGEGLRKNALDLDVYLKKVRELSRRQFLLRALMQKCREKAGLSDVYG